MISEKDFKVSCSSIGAIMTESKGKSKAQKVAELTAKISEATAKRDAIRDGLKSKLQAEERLIKMRAELELLNELPDIPELSDGAKTYCRNWLKQRVYERKPDIYSKYTEKGNKTEADAIELLERFYGWPLAMKNTRKEENDFMRGECDIELPEMIVDVKSSFSCWTFPIFESDIPETDYEWQIQGYMHLWKKEKGMVSFCLMDMPDEMIQKELRWKLPEGYSKEDYDREYSKFIYSNHPDHLRIKSFHFDYYPDKIARVEQRVKECRDYIKIILSYL